LTTGFCAIHANITTPIPALNPKGRTRRNAMNIRVKDNLKFKGKN